MLAPTSFALTCPATKMKAIYLSPASASSPSFALISVLALVSLAALTATAFLASARLERQATMPLTQTTILEMALDAGAECAKEVVDAPLNHFNHVTTYWRGTNPSDWTNELGYLLNGSARKTRTADRTSTIIVYASCFSSATFTNLGTNASELIVMTNDISSQGSFLNEMSANMRIQTNFAAGQSTNIPLLGDIPIPTNGPNRFTSPPVGWVYIKQDVRVKPGQTNTTNVPVARFAFYVQDLSGMIDAERMGGFTNGTPYRESTALPANYTPGTNPAEISLPNLTGTALTNATTASNFTSTNNRIKYLTPGMLVLSNGGGLNTNDLRYVTAGLLHWTNAYRRIPMGLGYGLSWSTNFLLDNAAINTTPRVTLTNITNWISTNLPGFTNRAGGMNRTNYLLALAANIIDYADANSTATSTNINGVNIVGFDNYPMLTHVFDQFLYDKDNRRITITTYLQFWNPSSVSTPALTGGTFAYNLNDTIRYPTNTAGDLFTNRPLSTSTLSVSSFSFSNGTNTTHSFGPNSGFITSIANTIDLTDAAKFPNFLNPGPNSLGIDTITGTDYDNAATNSFMLTGLGATNQPRIPLHRWSSSPTLNSGTPKWIGSVLGLRMSSGVGNEASSRLSADPRMLNYIGVGTTMQMAYNDYNSVYWQGYPSQFTTALLSGHPGNWPDGTNTANNPIPTRGITNPTVPPPGPFIIQDSLTLIADPAPCKISNSGSYTNICELGNIFDPIQWAPPATSALTNYANVDIPTGTTWTANNLYGGGSTLRIGRPEHSRFAWTNVAGSTSTVATPNMQMSAAALLDLFCTTLQFDESGKINLNTAPAPVLRALAGGIYLRSDPALSPGRTNFAVPPEMAEAFAQGVMRFRAKYPFHSPSQLAFIGTDPTWPNTNTWPSGAVFGNTTDIRLTTPVPGYSGPAIRNIGVTSWNDQAAEEWFSKIFNLSTTYSRNFRVYVIAQKATNQGGTNIGVGPVVRKYYNIITRCNDDRVTDAPGVGFSTRPTLEAPY